MTHRLLTLDWATLAGDRRERRSNYVGVLLRTAISSKPANKRPSVDSNQSTCRHLPACPTPRHRDAEGAVGVLPHRITPRRTA